MTRAEPVRLVDPAAAPALEELITAGVARLRDYQDDALAQRYEALVRRVADAEQQKVAGARALAEAVARNYAKLLAYKDEYEVGRLLSGEALHRQLEAQFEGDYRIAFNLAPPVLARRDPLTGRYRKREFGAWMLPMFRLLARLKGLRGTRFDIFGYSAHRRQERALITQYERMLEGLLAGLESGNHALAVKLAALPERVRGFDVVKEKSITETDALRERLLAEFAAAQMTARVLAA